MVVGRLVCVALLALRHRSADDSAESIRYGRYTAPHPTEMSAAIAIPTLASQSSAGCSGSSWSSLIGSHGLEEELGWLPDADMDLSMGTPPLANMSSAGEFRLRQKISTQPSNVVDIDQTHFDQTHFEVVTTNGKTLTFAVPPNGVSEEDARRPIAKAFGLRHCAFVLRDEQGWVTCASAATGGVRFLLELPDTFVRDAWTGGDAQLAWAMQPPSGDCEWLTISVNQAGGIAPARHVFDPPPAIVLAGAASFQADAAALLAQAVWKLWTPCWEDCTASCLFTGSATTSTDEKGRPVVSWHSMGITEISSKVRPPPGTSGMIGAGWFHLSVELPTGERLLLRDHNNYAARVVVKHQRCENTGGWRQNAVGPYANHCLCRQQGSHFDEHGRKLCRGQHS
eukprot:COSAG02_NODE_990_length_15413_cov_24.707457_1_plen_397_part_00